MVVNFFTILPLIMLAVWVLSAIRIIFSQRELSLKAGMNIVASACLIIGAAGFFLTIFISLNGSSYLPETFEWPVGTAENVVVTSDNTYIIPLLPIERIQIYDKDLKFQRGWFIDAGGGEFKLAAAGDNDFYIYTSRSNLRLHYDIYGKLISTKPFSSANYSKLKTEAHHRVEIPTPFYLLIFTDPVIASLFCALGGLLLFLAKKLEKIQESESWDKMSFQEKVSVTLEKSLELFNSWSLKPYFLQAVVIFTGILTCVTLSDINPILIIPTLAVVIFLIWYIDKRKHKIIFAEKNAGIYFPDETFIPWMNIKRLQIIKPNNSTTSIMENKNAKYYDPDRRLKLYYTDGESTDILTKEISYNGVGIDPAAFETNCFQYFNESLNNGNHIDYTLYKKDDLTRSFKVENIQPVLPIATVIISMFCAILIYPFTFFIPFILLIIFIIKVMPKYCISINEDGIDISGNMKIPWKSVKSVEHKYSDYKEVFKRDKITLYYSKDNSNITHKKTLQNIFFYFEDQYELVNLINYYISLHNRQTESWQH